MNEYSIYKSKTESIEFVDEGEFSSSDTKNELLFDGYTYVGQIEGKSIDDVQEKYKHKSDFYLTSDESLYNPYEDEFPFSSLTIEETNIKIYEYHRLKSLPDKSSATITLHIQSYLKARIDSRTVKTVKGEKKGIFGKSDILEKHKEFYVSNHKIKEKDKTIDGDRLAFDIQNAYLLIEKSGYEVQSITPISNRGVIEYYNPTSIAVGFSYTSGMIIIANKKS
ncbi:hypothetical protein [Vibrio echinoideorum]|uniref:Uncharacterized protein n=1 Tax=Vibrio echinoideorum TaxID=2100116 RepID=A0ABU9FL53_9VIBR